MFNVVVKHVGEVGVVVRARWGVGYRWANGVMGVETVIVVDVWMNCENGYGVSVCCCGVSG